MVDTLARGRRGLRAGIYVRISEDVKGTGLGVARQEEDCRSLAEQRGWDVVAVWSDNDISAYSGKRRPGYEQLFDAMKNRDVDIVVAWHPDRLHRSTRELEDFIDLIEATQVCAITVKAGEYDLATASGRMTARVIGAVARGESEHKSERIRRKAEELAKAGKPAGGKRMYGYELRDGDLVLIAEEAARIREAADRVLAGETLGSIWRDWVAREVPTTHGKAWSVNSIKRFLISGRIAGLREHHGEVVGPAEWEAIIAPEEHHRLRTILLDESRQKYSRVGRRYLLTGLIFCGICGEPLRSRRRGSGKPGYECAKKPGSRACGGIGRMAEPIDAYVTEAVLTALDGPAFAEALRARRAAQTDDTGILDAIRNDEEALEQLATDFGDRLISRKEYFAARSRFVERLEGNRRRLASASGTSVLETLESSGQVLREGWANADLDRRRSIFKAVMERIVLKPVGKGVHRFDAASVEIVWLA